MCTESRWSGFPVQGTALKYWPWNTLPKTQISHSRCALNQDEATWGLVMQERCNQGTSGFVLKDGTLCGKLVLKHSTLVATHMRPWLYKEWWDKHSAPWCTQGTSQVLGLSTGFPCTVLSLSTKLVVPWLHKTSSLVASRVLHKYCS
jgi:hypothetical protein